MKPEKRAVADIIVDMQAHFSLLLSACFLWGILDPTHEQGQGHRHHHHHDGNTVTKMLARLGLGPEGAAAGDAMDGGGGSGGDGGDASSEAVESSFEQLPRCWGYEKDCVKDDRLFVPVCDGPASPW